MSELEDRGKYPSETQKDEWIEKVKSTGESHGEATI